MALRIVRNDITKMNTEAIVSIGNEQGAGESVPEGEVFIAPGFGVRAKYIIYAGSLFWADGTSGEEEKLRSCYKKSLRLSQENQIKSIAFPLVAAGESGYPQEEGIRIAVDEIQAFLTDHEMDIFLVTADDKAKHYEKKICSTLDEYIDKNFVEEKRKEQHPAASVMRAAFGRKGENPGFFGMRLERFAASEGAAACPAMEETDENAFVDFESEHESRLEERIRHTTDTFSQYLLYLIQNKHMENAEVYKRAIVDKKIFSKIKNNVDYHPQKLTALCLCVGAKLNLDESRDLLARAGYALSPCDKTDIIFSYFIENEIYDMIELDIQLEEHGLPCIIS